MLGNVKDIGENGLKPASQSREYKYIFNLWLHSCMRILIISYKRVHDKIVDTIIFINVFRIRAFYCFII